MPVRRPTCTSTIMNPQTAAAQQAMPSTDPGWESTFKSMMGLDDPSGRRQRAFSAQPRSNRFDTILEAVVPSRKDPTHEKVLTLVNALVENGAVRAEEAGQMYDALLQRVSRYNSTNLQANLDRMVRDVREAVSARTRQENSPSLGSMVALNAFLATLPATVPRGQQDYASFVSALRLLVSEVPQVDVYQAGPDYYLQTSRGGAQTVNLTRAFHNLQPLWGVHGADSQRASVSALLTPNSRLLLLLVAPFTESVAIDRDSYLGYLLTLYRETLSQTTPDERTYREITDVSRSGLGEEDSENLRGTLNFLVSNRQQQTPQVFLLSPEQERALRYIQQAVSLYMTHNGVQAHQAIDQVAANLEPDFYHRHRAFLDRLLDYMRRAANTNQNYFNSIIMNAQWYPPPGFFTGDFEIPEEAGPLQGLDWDETWDRYRGTRFTPSLGSWINSLPPPSSGAQSIDGVSDVLDAARGSSLSGLEAALDNVTIRPARRGSSAAASDILDLPPPVGDGSERFTQYRERPSSALSTIASIEDEVAEASDLEGTGARNRFAYLRPHGVGRRRRL